MNRWETRTEHYSFECDGNGEPLALLLVVGKGKSFYVRPKANNVYSDWDYKDRKGDYWRYMSFGGR